jgi:polysaccharide export outer membrane protein
MNILTKYGLRIGGSLVLVFGLSACVGSGNTHFVQPDGASDGKDAAPPVTPITPELVKSQHEQRELQSGQNIKRLLGTPSPYLIGSGDVLSIVVWGHPELAGAVMTMPAPAVNNPELAGATAPPSGFVVDHEGMLQFPFAGELKLAGLTEEQARALLASKLARYINKPNITLRVQMYRSKRIYIDGEVKVAGLQPINDIPMTLVEALNRAGGALPTADQSNILITRGNASYQINLPRMMLKGIDPARIMLKHGDVVRVPSRDERKVFVAGEVITPKSLTMHDGRLTLNEALGESGGINPITADGRRVFVVRKTVKHPMVYQLDATTPGAMGIAESFELDPKDLIYVAASPLTNWHRAISQILPGALSQAVTAGKQ